jgi:hypothetical protein
VVKDILTHTWAQLACQLYVIRATRGSLDDVDWSTHDTFWVTERFAEVFKFLSLLVIM